MTNPPSFFRVRHRRLWGDYGQVLIAGMAARRDDRSTPLSLERTGPFAPAISLPGRRNIVVTDDCKQRIEVSCPESEFRSVVKERIVFSAWEEWDWDDERPEEMPEGGEPENYVMGKSHSDDAASEMGAMWELLVAFGAHVDTDEKRKAWDYDIRIHLETWNGLHIFLASKHGSTKGTWLIASGDGRAFLEANDTEGFLAFEPCLTKQPGICTKPQEIHDGS